METEQERRARQLEVIKRLRPIDDIFMTKIFEDKECAQLLLRVILGRKDLTVLEVVPQFEVKNLQGRSSKFDIYAKDNAGKYYDVEVQRANKGASPKRARYHSSLLDANLLRKRQDFNDLPETYVIFITEEDVLGGGKPIYTIERTIREMENKAFDDGSHIIYVNSEIRNETELGKLMWDLYCNDADKMNNKVLSERARYFKESEKGVVTMCDVMKEYVDWELTVAKEANKAATKRAVTRATKKASKENSRKFAARLWDSGMRDLAQIADLTDLSLSEVKKLFEDETNGR